MDQGRERSAYQHQLRPSDEQADLSPWAASYVGCLLSDFGYPRGDIQHHCQSFTARPESIVGIRSGLRADEASLHSDLMLAALIIGHHFSISAFCNACSAFALVPDRREPTIWISVRRAGLDALM
jgi:hypothetical protein